MKDEKMKCVSGGALNSPVSQDILEDIRHQVARVIWANKEVGHEFLSLVEKCHTVNEIFDKIETKEKIEAFLRLKGINHIDRADVDSILKVITILKSHRMVNKVVGGADLDRGLTLKGRLGDADYTRILDYINNNIIVSPVALTGLMAKLKGLQTGEAIIEWVSNHNSIVDVLSKYYSNKVELDSVAQKLSIVIARFLTSNLRGVAGGVDIPVTSIFDIPLTDEMVNEIAMKFNEFTTNPAHNLTAYGSNLPHLKSIIKEYGTVQSLYKALTNKPALCNIFTGLGYPVSDSKVITVIDTIIPWMKAYLDRFLKK